MSAADSPTDWRAIALGYHEARGGKIEVASKVRLDDQADLALAYTPHVGLVSMEIAANPEDVDRYTDRANMVAIVSDGTAVLGLGNLGPRAALPVMEGKALLFKRFADIDAIPLCLEVASSDELVALVRSLVPTFGGVNLEDIKAPECFEIESRLRDECAIPVFHDDQHGTATVVLAALENAARAVGREISTFRVVISGAGAAASATASMLFGRGIEDVVLVDSRGCLEPSRSGLDPHKQALALATNPRRVCGTLADAMRGSDVLIGLSAPGIVSAEMVRSMNPDSVVFAMANPVPEVFPDVALRNGAAIVGTGRSDFPNQINNALAFPGLFRGALTVRARQISEGMCRAAARGLALMVPDEAVHRGEVIPSIFAGGVAANVAYAAALEAALEGQARSPLTREQLIAALQQHGLTVTIDAAAPLRGA
jgi:malate dehydrogenase (oxaloacetate-decarboxylating)